MADRLGRMAIGDWMKSASWEANAGHTLAGACWLLITVLFTHAGAPIFYSELALLTIVLLKEYWIDLKYESGEDWRSSTVDALGYTLGNGLAWGLVALAHAVGSW